MNARADRFPLFDSVRALAALSILLFHVTWAGYNGLPSPLHDLAAHLDVGVTIFFVISGFLLYRPFVKARFRGEPVPHVGAYAWRRFLRIVPAYWVALTIIAIWQPVHGVFSHPLTYYGFAQIYSTHTFNGGIGPAWTLCIELTFYAFLPLWALLMRRTGPRALASEAIALALLALGSFVYVVVALHEQRVPTSNVALGLLPGYLDQFALGMALAVASAWFETRGRASALGRPLRRVPSAPWLLGVCAFCVASAFVVGQRPSTATFLAHHELYSLVGLCVVAPAVLFPAGAGVAGRVLSSRVLLYLGLWSYGIYLWHQTVIFKLVKPVGDVVPSGAGWATVGLFVPVFVVTVAIAAVSYYAVERPALSLKNRFPLRSRAARGEAIAEPAPAGPPSSA